MIGKVIVAVAVAAVAVVAVLIIFSLQRGIPGTNTAAVPNVKFVSFDADRKEIKVGETTNVLFNVQNFEDRAIGSSRVTIIIEPAGSGPYLSISNQTINLPQLLGKDAATGEIKISITATASPAKEALYTVKGVLFAEGAQSDSRDFDLKIDQQ